MSLKNLLKDFQELKNPKQAELLSKFFKTGKGEYGEGDEFLGIKVPDQRKLVGKYYKGLSLADTQKLIKSKMHEHRLTGLLILVKKYMSASAQDKQIIYELYLSNTKNINNWDLVDLSARDIVGNYLLDKDKTMLYKLANSKNLWEKRIAIISTYEFIRHNKFEDTLEIAKILINDKHDLIHKAVGWMLREVGNRNKNLEEKFLKKHCTKMPRTMLRYAIEKFNEKKRQYYLTAKK